MEGKLYLRVLAWHLCEVLLQQNNKPHSFYHTCPLLIITNPSTGEKHSILQTESSWEDSWFYNHPSDSTSEQWEWSIKFCRLKVLHETIWNYISSLYYIVIVYLKQIASENCWTRHFSNNLFLILHCFSYILVRCAPHLPHLFHQLQVRCWPVFFHPHTLCRFPTKTNWEIFCFCCVNVFLGKVNQNFDMRNWKNSPAFDYWVHSTK